ncbi:MAG TPA: BadF/BadG/BcrA/BcrD ATPase family protein [Solirubrobacteraceae bacterium]|nr:BadF/BadG/BcrA/BcrD ATPase family protein [Solirubrobacteraceae bacterium]
MTELVLAVDGGGAKTDLALLRPNGEVLSLVRGGGSSPHHVGVDGCIALLEQLRLQAFHRAGLDPAVPRRVLTGQFLIAGADLPEELETLRARIALMDWSERLVVENDTLALLRAGSDRGWGIAVVCGAGANCIGIAPDGRQARFLALGAITGDWGGGGDVGLAALGAAARSADGRGPRTVLESVVPRHFGMREPRDVSRALHLRELPSARLGELAPVAFAAAASDPVAAGLVDRLADEVVAFASAALRRLELTDEDPDVVLGGSLLRRAPDFALRRIEHGIRALCPQAGVILAPSAPIVGAALLALDDLDAAASATGRARAQLDEAVADLEAAGMDGPARLVRSAHG